MVLSILGVLLTGSQKNPLHARHWGCHHRCFDLQRGRCTLHSTRMQRLARTATGSSGASFCPALDGGSASLRVCRRVVAVRLVFPWPPASHSKGVGPAGHLATRCLVDLAACGGGLGYSSRACDWDFLPPPPLPPPPTRRQARCWAWAIRNSSARGSVSLCRRWGCARFPCWCDSRTPRPFPVPHAPPPPPPSPPAPRPPLTPIFSSSPRLLCRGRSCRRVSAAHS